jgi:hypothetical protein
MQAGEIDGIGVSGRGLCRSVSCAVNRGQPHRQEATDTDPRGMLNERGTGVTAIEEDPVPADEDVHSRNGDA